jgi:hypothetical protein
MAKVYFRLSITIPAEKLTTVIDVLNREGSDLEIRQVAVENGHNIPRAAYTKQSTTANGKRIDDVVKEYIALTRGSEFYWTGLVEEARKVGFAPTSVARPMKELMRSGKIKKLGKGRYQEARK